MTVAQAAADGTVFGIDLTLEMIARALGGHREADAASVFLFTDVGIVLAHTDARLAGLSGDGGFAWASLSGSADARLRAFWRAFAEGLVVPGRDLRIDLDGEIVLARLSAVQTPFADPVLVAAMVTEASVTAPIVRAQRRSLAAAGASLLVALGCILLVARSIAAPLRALSAEAHAIRRLELDRTIATGSRITEVAQLQSSMASMQGAIASFGRYVPRDLVQQLMASGIAPELGGARRPVTMLFTDIVGFTSTAETMDAEALMLVISAYLSAMTEGVSRHGGTVDKFIGDAVMAMWGAPLDDADHATHATIAALACARLSARLEAEFTARGWPALPTRFGLASGDVVVGHVGSADRIAYTAMGAVVNLASRLEALNRAYGTTILVSEATRDAADPRILFRPVDLVLPKGTRIPVAIFEPIGLSRAESATEADLLVGADRLAQGVRWQSVISDYRARRFEPALATIEAERGFEQDGLACLYRRRLLALLASPPAPDWNGIMAFSEK